MRSRAVLVDPLASSGGSGFRKRKPIHLRERPHCLPAFADAEAPFFRHGEINARQRYRIVAVFERVHSCSLIYVGPCGRADDRQTRLADDLGSVRLIVTSTGEARIGRIAANLVRGSRQSICARQPLRIRRSQTFGRASSARYRRLPF